MKSFIRLLTVLTGSAVIFAFTGISQDKTKISIIHHENGKTTRFDTLFDANTNYSVQDFIASKGLSPEKTEIINISEIAAQAFQVFRTSFNFEEFSEDMENDMEVIVLENEHPAGSKWINKSVEVDDEGNETITELRKKMDEDGNVFIEKLINGKEVELSRAEKNEIETCGEHLQKMPME